MNPFSPNSARSLAFEFYAKAWAQKPQEISQPAAEDTFVNGKDYHVLTPENFSLPKCSEEKQKELEGLYKQKLDHFEHTTTGITVYKLAGENEWCSFSSRDGEREATFNKGEWYTRTFLSPLFEDSFFEEVEDTTLADLFKDGINLVTLQDKCHQFLTGITQNDVFPPGTDPAFYERRAGKLLEKASELVKENKPEVAKCILETINLGYYNTRHSERKLLSKLHTEATNALLTQIKVDSSSKSSNKESTTRSTPGSTDYIGFSRYGSLY